MTLKTYIRSIWANNPEDITGYLNEDAFLLSLMLNLWLASSMGKTHILIGLDSVLCFKIWWKIQIWCQLWVIRCITSSNVIFFIILEHFFLSSTTTDAVFQARQNSAQTSTPFYKPILCALSLGGGLIFHTWQHP